MVEREGGIHAFESVFDCHTYVSVVIVPVCSALPAPSAAVCMRKARAKIQIFFLGGARPVFTTERLGVCV